MIDLWWLLSDEKTKKLVKTLRRNAEFWRQNFLITVEIIDPWVAIGTFSLA